MEAQQTAAQATRVSCCLSFDCLNASLSTSYLLHIELHRFVLKMFDFNYSPLIYVSLDSWKAT